MTSLDKDDQVPELADEWLSEKDLNDRRRRQQQYKRNQMIQTTVQQRQQQEDGDEEVPMPVQEDNDSDNDDDNDGDYWQPRKNTHRWVTNQQYYGDEFEMRMQLNQSAAYAKLL